MSQYPYFTGDPSKASADRWRLLPRPSRETMIDPAHYVTHPSLVDAVNVALALGQPLLLTGEPGTGKTQLANYIAFELGLGAPLKFEVKSDTVSRDLFYTYDAVGRFHASQSGTGSTEARDHITYQALGLAILHANEPEAAREYASADFKHPGMQRSLVLLDEIDKAPRDVPNDILNELDGMYFRVPELGGVRIAASPEMHPVVVITNNSEKALPDTFLRRCVYYSIPFPDPKQLADIVSARLGMYAGGSSALLGDALSLFAMIRDPQRRIRKRPGTAELLNWLAVLQDMGVRADDRLRSNDQWVYSSVPTLFKTVEDQELAPDLLKEWKDSE